MVSGKMISSMVREHCSNQKLLMSESSKMARKMETEFCLGMVKLRNMTDNGRITIIVILII